MAHDAPNFVIERLLGNGWTATGRYLSSKAAISSAKSTDRRHARLGGEPVPWRLKLGRRVIYRSSGEPVESSALEELALIRMEKRHKEEEAYDLMTGGVHA